MKNMYLLKLVMMVLALRRSIYRVYSNDFTEQIEEEVGMLAEQVSDWQFVSILLKRMNKPYMYEVR